jgi:hypothetical protein
MIIDCEEEFVTLNLDNRTDTILMSADEAEKCIHGLQIFAQYIEFVQPKLRPITEIWDIKIGLHEEGVALKFNKNTKKVRLPHKIAIELVKQLNTALSSYKRGFSLKFINKAKI